MSVREVQRITGGWSNVPENLKTKTQLNEMGLKPIDIDAPRAEVWSYRSWVKLYDVELDTKPKKKPTEKQLAALAVGVSTCVCGRKEALANFLALRGKYDILGVPQTIPLYILQNKDDHSWNCGHHRYAFSYRGWRYLY